MQHELKVMIIRPADRCNMFRITPNDIGVKNIFDNYDELHLVIEGSAISSELPSIKIVNRPGIGKTELAAEPVEPGEYRWGGKWIYGLSNEYLDICAYPIPLLDRITDYSWVNNATNRNE